MNGMIVEPKDRPELDPDLVPAELWNSAYEARVEVDPGSVPLVDASLPRLAHKL